MHDSEISWSHFFYFFILFIIYIWASILGQHAHKTKSTTKPQVQYDGQTTTTHSSPINTFTYLFTHIHKHSQKFLSKNTNYNKTSPPFRCAKISYIQPKAFRN